MAGDEMTRNDDQEAGRDVIIAAPLSCPNCGTAHVDEGEWETRPHRTHLCLSCGHEWRVTVYGVPTPQPVAGDGERWRLVAERWVKGDTDERAPMYAVYKVLGDPDVSAWPFERVGDIWDADVADLLNSLARPAPSSELVEACESYCRWCKQGLPFEDDPLIVGRGGTWHQDGSGWVQCDLQSRVAAVVARYRIDAAKNGGTR